MQKDYSFKNQIIERVKECAYSGEVPDVELPANAALEATLRTPCPLVKEDLIEQRVSRMAMKQLELD